MDGDRNGFAVCLPRVAMVFGLGLLTGCASMVKYVRCYPGPERPRREVGIVTERNPYLRELVVFGVDDMDTKDVQFGGVLELTPGKHRIRTLYLSRSTACGSVHTTTGRFTLEIDVEAGHVYEMYPVFHTHDNGWYTGTWDVTDELKRPEKADLARKLAAILEQNGITNGSFAAAGNGTMAAAGSVGRLPGFGEKIRARVPGMKGAEVDVEYGFDRYKPCVEARGSDGRDYHLRISQQDGTVQQVFGIKLTRDGYVLFQPMGSDTASLVIGNRKRVYRELPDGSYERTDYKKMPDGSYSRDE